MIQINVYKRKKHAFTVNLSKRDARKFLSKFKGEKTTYHIVKGDNEFNFDMICSYPKNYRLESFDYPRNDSLKRAFELMDGDL